MEIIVHSDDIGATPHVTSRILEAWESGFIDGFSIFANGDRLDWIERSLNEDPKRRVRLVVHLNLTEGRPILPPSALPRLTDKQGFLRGTFLGLILEHLLGSKSAKKAIESEVEREWRAQIEKTINLCKPRGLSGIDGHIHIHMIPFLFRIAVKLAKEYRIPEIRMCREPFYWSSTISEGLSLQFVVNLVKCLVLRICSLPNIRVAQDAGIGYPDTMLGVLHSGIMSEANILAGLRAAERQGSRRVEVLVHIGRAQDTELDRWNAKKKRAAFVLSPRRDIEYAELKRLKRSFQPPGRKSRGRQK